MSGAKTMLPDVHFGEAKEDRVDWRAAPDETSDDDEELSATPPDVVQLLGFDPKEMTRADAEFHEEDHPRDKDGKFGNGVESSKTETNFSEMGNEDFKSKTGLSISSDFGLKSGSPASPEALGKVRQAILSLPKEHLDLLPSYFRFVVVSDIKADGQGTAGIYFHEEKNRIEVAENYTISGVRRKVPMIEHCAAHETGHAIDHAAGWRSRSGGFGKSVEASSANLTASERSNAKYFLESREEAFAETYALVYGKGPEHNRYFGCMKKDRALKVMKPAIDAMEKGLAYYMSVNKKS